jgi:hypothetical protein
MLIDILIAATYVNVDRVATCSTLIDDHFGEFEHHLVPGVGVDLLKQSCVTLFGWID